MHKPDKSEFKAQTFAEAERCNVFEKTISLSERLNQGWYLSAMPYGIDPYNPPKMEKRMFSKIEKRMFFAGTHEDHQKYMDDLDKKYQEKQTS